MMLACGVQGWRIGLNGRAFHRRRRGIQGLAQTLGLLGADDRLFQQEIDG